MSPEKTRITGFEDGQWQFDGSDQWNAEASAEIVDGGLDGSKWQKLHYQQGDLHQKYIMGEFLPIDASKCRYITFYAKADQEVTFRIYLQADWKGGHAKVTVKDEGWYSVPLSEWTTTVKGFDTSKIHFLQFHFNGFFEGEGYLYVDGLCLTEGDYSKGEFDTAGEPENPEKPENPENPEKPENPENPENPEKPESPDTGAARSAVLPLAALAAGSRAGDGRHPSEEQTLNRSDRIKQTPLILQGREASGINRRFPPPERNGRAKGQNGAALAPVPSYSVQGDSERKVIS